LSALRLSFVGDFFFSTRVLTLFSNSRFFLIDAGVSLMFGLIDSDVSFVDEVRFRFRPRVSGLDVCFKGTVSIVGGKNGFGDLNLPF